MGGESFLMHVRLAPTNATMDVKESECQSYQSVYDPTTITCHVAWPLRLTRIVFISAHSHSLCFWIFLE